ncbi:hypothetical protein Pla163_02530 [Planctomycetes bacterium Pla163]|uniref:Uncharacterized protein n=1 Tax=Rohdeia mirabilis TaxID=2528008 RepID=A0A518CVA7_9BACT|nr:hypothetical protein Pla163_02530 [Planctomycetes bacterium Pla163]
MNSQRWTLALALLVAIGALVWVFSGPAEGDGDAFARTETEQSEEAAPEASAPVAPLADDEREAVTAPPTDDVADVAPPVEHVVVPDPRADGVPTRRVDGTVVVSDSAGVEHFTESGTGAAMVWIGNTGTLEKLAIEDGRWFLDVPLEARLGFQDFVLGGRTARLDAEAPRAIPDHGRVTVNARWVDAAVLRVLAVDTGLELEGVEVREIENDVAYPDLPRSPGASGEVLFAAAASPVELPTTRRPFQPAKAVLRVRAPGYAWGAITVDLLAGGQHDIVLERAGGLDVALVGDASGATLRVEVPYEEWIRGTPVFARVDDATRQLLLENANGQRGPLIREQALGDEREIAIDSIPPGDYDVRVEFGAATAEPVLLGLARALVPEGGRGSVAVTIEPPPEVVLVPLRGEVVVPPEWGLGAGFILNLELLDEPAPGRSAHSHPDVRFPADANGVYPFDAGAVEPGRYVAYVHFHMLAVELVVGPEGAIDARIEFPPPARVRIEARDAAGATGPEAGLTTIIWHSLGSWNTDSITRAQADVDLETGLFEFFAPPGRIEVGPVGSAWESGPQQFDVVAGVNAFTLDVRRGLGFRLVLMDGETAVPMGTFAAFVQAVRVDAEGTSNGTYVTARGTEFSVPAPGTYAVQVPQIAGFRPLAVQEIQIGAGEFVERVVQLVRE